MVSPPISRVGNVGQRLIESAAQRRRPAGARFECDFAVRPPRPIQSRATVFQLSKAPSAESLIQIIAPGPAYAPGASRTCRDGRWSGVRFAARTSRSACNGLPTLRRTRSVISSASRRRRRFFTGRPTRHERRSSSRCCSGMLRRPQRRPQRPRRPLGESCAALHRQRFPELPGVRPSRSPA